MLPPARRMLLALCLGAALAAARASAHETLDEALAQVDAALARAPEDPELWRRRAALARAAGDFGRADADLDRAIAVGLAPARAERERGVTLERARRPAEAEPHLRRARALAPADLETLEAHAEALAALGRWREAADTWTRVVELAPGAGPDLHLARVRALASGGAPAQDEALRAVDAAIASLGPVPALEQAGILLELRAGRSDAALARLERFPAAARRREAWQLQRAEILAQAGRVEAARAAYATALATLAQRPPARRHTPAALALEARAREGLARLPAMAAAR
jgi:Flp pilus assembly protein TadD